MKLPVHNPRSEGGCGACPAGNRREFLRDAAAVVAGALVGLGMAPEGAHALELRTIVPLRTSGEEVIYPIPAGDGVMIDKDRVLILARQATAIYAFSLACPHQRTALRWLGEQGRFQCPKHKSRYRPDGSYISGRATRSMDRFAIRRDGADVVVNLSQLFREDRDRAEWGAAVVWLGEK
ncbi:MAG: Rieske (2Fe-2S) protein [Gemmatimonadetes bacterium]|nr:Rieske (2Fe-2S) protein [Gemmatimonadota bacterium]